MFGFFKILVRFVSLILGVEDGKSFPAPLAQEKERELFVKKQEGDGQARALLIEHNLRLVSHIIKKYYASYENPDELLSIGSLGLIKAVDSFKSDFGTKFATYGAKCIQNEILMFLRSKKRGGVEISINDAIEVDKDGNSLTYLDIISTDESIERELDLKICTEKLHRFVASALGNREKEIIVLRYGLEGYQPKTQREVAKYLGISRSYVSRIEKRALGKLKECFGDRSPDLND